MKNNKCSYWQHANKVGLFFVVLFIICFAWYFIKPEKELHLQLLQLSFFGFSGMNIASFIFGAIQAYLAGYIGLALWRLFDTCSCCKKDNC